MFVDVVRSLRIAALVWLAMPGTTALAKDAVWDALRQGGHAILLRHAIAPGTGDPPGFVLRDCGTQRNLSAEGREQARLFGVMLRQNTVRVDRVQSSRWCRALDTARLLDLAPVEELAALDSFFAAPERQAPQVAAMREALASASDETVMMVTHQVNITALTGVVPASGEGVVVKLDASGQISVVGRIPPP